MIGDYVLDKYVRGTVSRISPEAPIPVLLSNEESVTLGGAGNVVANIKSLGAAVVPIGLLGNGGAGGKICDLLADLGVETATLHRASARSTPVKTRFVSGKQQLLRLDEERVQIPTEEEHGWLTERAQEVACDIAILSDYGKGTFDKRTTEALIATFRARGIPVLVDPKGNDYSKYAGATAVSPNLKELGEVAGRALDGDENIAAAGRKLISDLGLDFVLATRSEDGLSVVMAERDFQMPTRAKEVFDVSGAGDTLISTFAVALAAGHSLEDSSQLANAAAGVVVAKSGTASLTLSELERALGEDLEAQHGSVAPLEIARFIVERWRDDGLEVGFTNGCFDILHPGHVSLLEQSAKACDRLIVGLNSDASVRRLKGPSRPVVDEAARGRMLAALATVDLVVIFEEDTPFELISALLPDVLVKGSDYAEADIIGADVVKANGGRVVRATLVEGKSTSKIIGRIEATVRSRDNV